MGRCWNGSGTEKSNESTGGRGARGQGNMSLRRTKDFTGFRQGRLVAIKDVGSNGKSRIWLVRCDCGVEKILGTKSFSPTSLVRSCGCQKIEAAKVVSKTHGMSQHRLYSIWTSMRNRCRNPNDRVIKTTEAEELMLIPNGTILLSL